MPLSQAATALEKRLHLGQGFSFGLQIDGEVFVGCVVDGGSVAVVQAAFKTEIERAGHQVVFGMGADTDAVVKVDLKRMRIAMREASTKLVKTVLLTADVSVWRTGQESRAARFEVTETQEKSYYTLVLKQAHYGW